jgi:hypothetical protein
MAEEPEELGDAHRASMNSAVLTAITLVFGVIWLIDRDELPSWLVSAWFIVVIPLNLYLMFMYRRRYRLLREAQDESLTHRDSPDA